MPCLQCFTCPNYFESATFFFLVSPSVYTYPVSPACKSATFWICSPELTFLNTQKSGYVLTVKSRYFLIRWPKSTFSSVSAPIVTLILIKVKEAKTTKQRMKWWICPQIHTRNWLLRSCVDNIYRVFLDTRVNPDTNMDRQIRFEYDTYGRESFQIRHKKNCGFKISRYVLTGRSLVMSCRTFAPRPSICKHF